MKTSRRDFVIKSALVAAAMVSSNNAAGEIIPAAFKPFNAHNSNSQAKICFFSKMLPEAGYGELAAIVAACGFDGIDLTVRKRGHVLPENVERDLPLAAAAAAKSGLKIYMITTDILDGEDPFIELILKTAAALGIQHYRLGFRLYDERKTIPQNLEAIKTKYQKLSELNRKYTIRGECQNHSGDGFGAPVWDLWEVLKDIDPQWIGVQYDVLHATIEGAGSWAIGFNLLKPWIGTLDIKDFYWKKTEGKWGHELIPLGEGMVDYKKYFALLKENNMQGPFSIHCEFLQEKVALDSKAIKMKRELTTLREWLKAAGL